jgi:hypothetical protein
MFTRELRLPAFIIIVGLPLAVNRLDVEAGATPPKLFPARSRLLGLKNPCQGLPISLRSSTQESKGRNHYL